MTERRKVEVKLMKIGFRFYLGSEESRVQLLHYAHKLNTEIRNGTVIVVACQLETIYENHSSIIFIRFIRASRVNWTVRENRVKTLHFKNMVFHTFFSYVPVGILILLLFLS